MKRIFSFLLLALFLAGTPAALAATASTSFTSATTGNVLSIEKGETATYAVSGTFVGTVALQRSRNSGASWEVVTTATGSASGTVANETTNNERYRFVATAYTSGTIVTTISDVSDIVREFRNRAGDVVLRLRDAGVEVPGTFTVTGSVVNPPNASQTLTDGATIAWDANSGAVATVTLGGNRTLSAPTNLTVGTYILHIIQDGTGSRTLTFTAVFKWARGAAPTLTITAAARDTVSCISDATNLYCGYLLDVK